MEIKDLFPAVLTLLLVAILLGVGLTILGTFATGVRTATIGNSSNVQIFSNNNTALSNSYISSDTLRSKNATTGVDTTQYLVPDYTGQYKTTRVGFSTSVAAGLNGSAQNFTYTYGNSNTWQTAIDNSTTGIDDFVTWFGIIVVIVAAAIIIGLIMRSFNVR